MRIKLLRFRLCAAPVIFAAMLTICTSVRPVLAQTAYNSKFSIAEQSVDNKGRTVVVMQGTGDLPGVLTLVLSVGSDGAVSGGEWALNVSYTAPLHPEVQIDPTMQDPDAAQGEKLVQKGVLSGTISGGSITTVNGVISGISSLQLLVTHGTMTFASVTSGSGSASGTQLDSRANSSAFTSLTF